MTIHGRVHKRQTTYPTAIVINSSSLLAVVELFQWWSSRGTLRQTVIAGCCANHATHAAMCDKKIVRKHLAHHGSLRLLLIATHVRPVHNFWANTTTHMWMATITVMILSSGGFSFFVDCLRKNTEDEEGVLIHTNCQIRQAKGKHVEVQQKFFSIT